MESNISLHFIQNEILKKLALNPALRFNDLLIEGLESEHMNYHLKKLVELKFVRKEKQSYMLTDLGKDYSNRMDDEVKIIEKQPKTSILIHGIRINPQTKGVEHLLSKRLKHPYYGKVGRLTGKVKFGETLEQAVKRELYEETGLTAKKVVLEEIYHKLRHRGKDEFIQDVIFYRFFVTDFSGDFISKLPYQENIWVNSDDKKTLGELDLFDDLELDNRLTPKAFRLKESVGPAEGF